MTEREQEVLELAIEWRRSKFAVAEALVRQKMVHAIDMLMKERRDAEVKVATDGEWIQPRRRGYRLQCCDCGLIHRLNFRLVTTPNGGKTIQFQAFRDNRATAQVRRKPQRKE